MTNSHPTWSGTLVLGRGIVVYVGPGSSAETHRHDATQLIWSPTSPIRVHTEHASTTTRAALIPPRQPHGFVADGNDIAVVLVEPSGPLGQQLASLAAHHNLPELEARLTDIRLPATNDAASTLEWSRQVLAATLDAETLNNRVQVRPEVLNASQFIDDHLAETPLLTAAAHHVGLSSRQLRRSFTTEIGIPFRRYVLWRRLRRALLAVDDGADLTTAAATAGFADSAHFSRTFRQTFGLTPSDVLPLVTVAETDFPEA